MAGPTREQELQLLKQQAELMTDELERLQSRIQELTSGSAQE